MLNIEKQSFWEILAQSGKPAVLYGAGDGADKILDFCASRDINIAGIFASVVRGAKYFRGFKIKSFAEIQDIYGENFCILLSFAANIDSVIKNIYDLHDKYELYAPNFPVFGEQTYFDYDYYAKNREEIERAHDLLADDESKSVYENAINFNITGRLDYLAAMDSCKRNALDLLELGGGAHYIDLGAYNGDTVFEMLDYANRRGQGRIAKIAAFEPDMKNFAKLQKNITEAGLADICDLYRLGAWSEAGVQYFNAQSSRNSNFDAAGTLSVSVDSLDNILYPKISGELLIKYDIEGSEFEALTGSRRIIQEYSPKLIVSLYHKTGDIFKLPLYIRSMNPRYKFYLRKHKYIPCWDLNLYAAVT